MITTSNNGRPPVEGAELPEALARVVNRLIKLLLRSPLHRLFSKHLMLLAFRGRKSDKKLGALCRTSSYRHPQCQP